LAILDGLVIFSLSFFFRLVCLACSQYPYSFFFSFLKMWGCKGWFFTLFLFCFCLFSLHCLLFWLIVYLLINNIFFVPRVLLLLMYLPFLASFRMSEAVVVWEQGIENADEIDFRSYSNLGIGYSVCVLYFSFS
jgi:hypothetical protein